MLIASVCKSVKRHILHKNAEIDDITLETQKVNTAALRQRGSLISFIVKSKLSIFFELTLITE